MAFASSQPLSLRHVSTAPVITPLRPSTRRPSRSPRPTLRMVQKNLPVVSPYPSIGELLKSANQFSTLLGIIGVSGISPAAIKGTVFAPTNAAFAKLPAELLQMFMSDDVMARNLVWRHVMLDEVPLRKLTGDGFLNSMYDGELGYTSFGGKQLKIGGASIEPFCDKKFDKGLVHAISNVLRPPSQKWPSFEQTFSPAPASAPAVGEFATARARGATVPSTVGGRKAMGLISQKPFWMYGPPYCAAKQEEYEPISAAAPEVSSVDYQLMPPGSVVVSPDSVNAAELNPVSGMSKYIGQTKRIVEGDALSDYSKLD